MENSAPEWSWVQQQIPGGSHGAPFLFTFKSPSPKGVFGPWLCLRRKLISAALPPARISDFWHLPLPVTPIWASLLLSFPILAVTVCWIPMLQ